MTIRQRLVQWVFSKELQELHEREDQLTREVNQRVAFIVSQLDPFEPLLKQFHGVFSEEFTSAEDNLSEPAQLALFMWAYTQKNDPYFKHLTSFLLNTQGNATIRQAQNDREWFFGRAVISTLLLFIREVERLSSHYEDILAKRDRSFDPYLPVTPD